MNIQQYFADCPSNRQTSLQAIHQLILQLFPQVKCSMRYNMPTYETEQGWLAMASQKHYLSVYTCSAQHLQAFKLLQPKIKAGQGCLNFKDNQTIPLQDLHLVITSALSTGKH